jgi:hypothetical protein
VIEMRNTVSRLARSSATGVLFTALCLMPCLAQPLEPIALPKPQTDTGKPLMQSLAERRTTRAFTDRKFPPQMLSNLLWAAFGVNRPKMERPGIGRTAPSAMNRQEIDLYVALPEGVYVYEAEPHRLKPVAAGDVRARMGPPAAAAAAATILYVSDYAKAAMPSGGDPQPPFAYVDVGFIGQNVYLFAASEGLGAWFRAGVPDAKGIAASLNLRRDQRILYVQTIGYPAK